jgi:hypothetical protein
MTGVTGPARRGRAVTGRSQDVDRIAATRRAVVKCDDDWHKSQK